MKMEVPYLSIMSVVVKTLLTTAQHFTRWYCYCCRRKCL